MGETRVAAEGDATVRNRLQDLVPADLVTAIVTEHGVLRAPFADALEAARAAAAAGGATLARRPARGRHPRRRSHDHGGGVMATVAVGSRGTLVARSTADRVLLREYLERDRLFAAYAICDLGEREFPRTRWGIATVGERPVAVALEYGGLTPQPLFVMGEPGRDRGDPARRRPAARGLRRRQARVARRPSRSTTGWSPAPR